jgi:hypothetical protein
MHPMNRNKGNLVGVGIWLKLVKASVKNLSGVTLKEILAEMAHLTGNTRFMSVSVIIAFFLSGLKEKEGYLLLGYYQSQGMRDRLEAAHLEVKNLYRAYVRLQEAGLVKRPLSWLLDPERRNTRGHRYSKNRINFSRRIAQEMVIYHLGSKKRAAEMSGVPLRSINFWLNY